MEPTMEALRCSACGVTTAKYRGWAFSFACLTPGKAGPSHAWEVADVPVAVVVDEQIKDAIVAAKAKLREHEATMAKYDKEIGKLDRAVQRERKKSGDDTITAAEQAASDALTTAHGRYLSAYDAVSRTRKLLAQLNDPAEREARIERAAAGKTTTADRPNRKEGHTMTSSTPKHEVPTAVIDRIVKDVDGGVSVTVIADALNKEKVKAPGRSATWIRRHVAVLYTAKTGKSISEARKAAPLPSRAVKDLPPAETRTLPKKTTTARTGQRKATTSSKTTSASKPQAKPDPKSGAKKASSARKRSTARR